MLDGMEIEATHTNLDSRAVAGASIVVMLISLAFANFTGGDGGTGPYLVCAAACILVAAFVYLRTVPRARENGAERRATFVLTGMSLLFLPVFWTGLTLILAPPAAWLALAAPGKGTQSALVVAARVYLAAVGACLFG
jgi:hypothetical protein